LVPVRGRVFSLQLCSSPTLLSSRYWRSLSPGIKQPESEGSTHFCPEQRLGMHGAIFPLFHMACY